MVDNLINERIAKKIANSGLCSRREAERLINNGCVKLNGNVIKNCNTNVTTKDIIEVVTNINTKRIVIIAIPFQDIFDLYL